MDAAVGSRIVVTGAIVVGPARVGAVEVSTAKLVGAADVVAAWVVTMAGQAEVGLDVVSLAGVAVSGSGGLGEADRLCEKVWRADVVLSFHSSTSSLREPPLRVLDGDLLGSEADGTAVQLG
jgi:hypothetical protein